ncbi:SIMPL domain-containing protein [Roseofilum sp. BLCC_M154]|uniref:SIMPL domain-containing protein n=1 Tax=Roseofilum acuticapitatum BLCC-M154 TaxID=3022444 RepID=A0ABT7AWA9_9CYAN|nr:SIMPL domain-containing protein [Roseofilum acuticapitatum]MDJ1171155.1 SIMPL domain-containing protein [Roseofilum acuticapitatum BLCC-M154]
MHPIQTTRSTAHPAWGRLSILPLAIGVMGFSVLMGNWYSPKPVNAQEQQQLLQTLTVTGRGIERIPTTLTLVNLGVEVQGKTAQEVQAQVARQSSAVVKLLQERQVEQLETTGIRLTPNYSYSNDTQRLTGYTATNTVSFRIETSKAGSLIDEAVQAGATRIDGISFIATDEAIAEAQQVALRQATADAQKQAQTVLDALNLSSRSIVSIQINHASAPSPIRLDGANFARAESAPSPVMGGEQQVEASVTLQIRY